MERKFKITIGEKTFTVKVEEVTEVVTPATPKVPVRTQVVETPAIAVTRAPTLTPSEEGVVRAPMPGVILSIKRKVGNKVEAGDLLLTLEAMKMENNVYAPKSGVIKKVAVSEKQSVKYGDILIEIS